MPHAVHSLLARCGQRAAPASLAARSARRWRCLAAGMLLGTTIAHAQTPAATTPDTSVDPVLMGRAADILYSRQLASLRAAQLLDTDRAALGRARRVGDRLLPRVTAVVPPGVRWSARLSLETRNEPVALCLPNGSVLVSTGLLQLPLDDAELAAILAHVIAHQVNGDHARAAARAYRQRREGVDPDANRAAVELADILGKLVGSPHDDAAAEKAADALALELLARSGVNPAAAARAWRKVVQAGDASAPALLALHPTPPERIADLEALAAQLAPVYEQALADAAAAPPPPPPETRPSTSRHLPPRMPKPTP